MTEIRKANGHRYHGLVRSQRRPIDPRFRPDPATLGYDLEAAAGAVLALQTEVPEDAFTAGTLGTEREGNGVLIDTEGTVLTIGYLVTEAERVVLTDRAGRSIPATVIGYDQVTGFGLVHAEMPIEAEPLALGGADQVEEGQPVVALSHGGTTYAIAAHLAAKREFAGYWEYLLDTALFTVPPHPHWSGAALLGPDGRVHGIGSLFVQDALPAAEPRPGNMFVPADLLPPILDDLKRYGRAQRTPRPWLGLLAAEHDGHLVIAGTIDGGPAEEAGARPGDVIVSVAGAEVDGLAGLYRRVWSLGPAGVEVPIHLLRDGDPRAVRIRSADRNDFLKRPQHH